MTQECRLAAATESQNKALKTSTESISGKRWDMEQVQVPQQDKGESCGYSMLSNLSKVTKGQKKYNWREIKNAAGSITTVPPQIQEPGYKNLKSLDLALMPTSDATSTHNSRLLHPELRFLNLGWHCTWK